MAFSWPLLARFRAALIGRWFRRRRLRSLRGSGFLPARPDDGGGAYRRRPLVRPPPRKPLSLATRPRAAPLQRWYLARPGIPPRRLRGPGGPETAPPPAFPD